MLIAGTTQGDVEPSAVADAVLSGVKANQFLVTTHAGELVAAAEARMALARSLGAEPAAASSEPAWMAAGRVSGEAPESGSS
jgi:hypothetical protein